MLIFMGGMPSSGKSLVVDHLTERFDIHVVSPSEWLPDNIDDLSGDEEKSFRIECWRMALDTVEHTIENVNGAEFIILDCANSKFKPISHIVRKAKRLHHRVMMLYVNARTSICKDRAGDKWIGDDVGKSYAANFRDSLPKFRSRCDRLVVVENNSTTTVLHNNLLEAWSKLCQIT